MSRQQIVHVRSDSDGDLDALFSVLKNRDVPMSSSYKNRKLPASFFNPSSNNINNSSIMNNNNNNNLINHNNNNNNLTNILNNNNNNNNNQCLQNNNNNNIMMMNMMMMNPPSQIPQSNHTRSISSPSQTPHKYPNLDLPISPEVYWMATGNNRYYNNNPSNNYFQQQQQQQQTYLPHFFDQQQQLLNQQSKQQCLQQQQQQQNNTDFGDYVFNIKQQQQQQQQTLNPWDQSINEGELYFANNNNDNNNNNDMFTLDAIDLEEFDQQVNFPNNITGNNNINNLSTPVQQIHNNNNNNIQFELQKLQQHKLRNQEKQKALNCREMMLAELAKKTKPCENRNDLIQLKQHQQQKIMKQNLPQKLYPYYNQQQQSHRYHLTKQQQQFQQQQQQFQQQQFNPQQQLKFNPQQQLKLNPQQQHYLKNLDQNFSAADSHIRQNSTDSGLGGMGTTYSLPRSPEECLSNVDEVDGKEEDSEAQGHSLKDVVLHMDEDACFIPALSECIDDTVVMEEDDKAGSLMFI